MAHVSACGGFVWQKKSVLMCACLGRRSAVRRASPLRSAPVYVRCLYVAPDTAVSAVSCVGARDRIFISFIYAADS